MDATDRFRILAVGLVVVFLLIGGTAIAVAEPASQDREWVDQPPGSIADVPPAFDGFADVVQQIDPDTVLLNVGLSEDGDAAWTVEYRVRLDDANTTEAFEAYRDDIEANANEYETQFGDRMGPTVRTAENTTGRDMAIRNVTIDATRRQLPQEYGVVTYRFTWTNFGVSEGDRLGAGDALAGFFLDEETTMTVSWPESHRVDSVEPPADATSGDSVTWEGPLNFASDEPRLVVTSGATTQSETTDATAGDGALVPWWLLAFVALLVVLVAVPVAVWFRERDEQPDETTGGTEEDRTDDDGVPPELLTDEERVLSLLEKRGGRVKQQDIAGECDWTDAKTSQVVTRLREDDAVDVLRIGRENVVSLPDESDI